MILVVFLRRHACSDCQGKAPLTFSVRFGPLSSWWEAGWASPNIGWSQGIYCPLRIAIFAFPSLIYIPILLPNVCVVWGERIPTLLKHVGFLSFHIIDTITIHNSYRLQQSEHRPSASIDPDGVRVSMCNSNILDSGRGLAYHRNNLIVSIRVCGHGITQWYT